MLQQQSSSFTARQTCFTPMLTQISISSVKTTIVLKFVINKLFLVFCKPSHLYTEMSSKSRHRGNYSNTENKRGLLLSTKVSWTQLDEDFSSPAEEVDKPPAIPQLCKKLKDLFTILVSLRLSLPSLCISSCK